jgi:hypothetical protein
MKLPDITANSFSVKDVLKLLFILIIALGIFFGGRYTAKTQNDKKPVVLKSKNTSITIGLDGSVNLYNYDTNELTVLPDSMSQQVFLLYTSIIKNQNIITGGR